MEQREQRKMFDLENKRKNICNIIPLDNAFHEWVVRKVFVIPLCLLDSGKLGVMVNVYTF